MTIPSHSLPLEVLPWTLAICRLPPDAPMPEWVRGAAFLTASRTPEELSITVDQALVPPDIRSQMNYRAIRVRDVLPPDLIGILVAIGAPLAAAGLPIFAISTFDTDYVLLRAADLETGLETLRRAGHRIAA
ncbi:MAG TPA: ACT domain-containing protein [Gemmatimonadales bacterium]|nr:ACT domain-containing protein [Gemmatimonadales bacterium]